MENPFSYNTDIVPVSVLASFNKEGKMIPIYFSVEGIRVKVDSIVWGKENLAWGSHYRCKVCVSEVTQDVELMYFKSRNTWALRKNK